MKRTPIAVGIGSALLLVATTSSEAASIWTLARAGVWDIPAKKRVKWNPATGDIGNMGNAGVVYNVSAPPANVQAGAAAQATAGYTFWNALAAIPTVRINFAAGAANVANSITSWGNTTVAGALGETSNIMVDFNNRNITLSSARTVRSDGWNLFKTGANAIQQFDTYTVNVHEAGHVLGLDHPGTNTQIMAQTGASQGAGGRFKAVEQVSPFMGEPLALNAAGVPANALAAGTKAYFQPRNSFGLGDAIGAITVYSAPISAIVGGFQQLAAGSGKFTYSVTNNSAHGAVGGTQYLSGYNERQFTIPVAPGVPVSNLVAPAGYTITRESTDVLVQSIDSSYDLTPGSSLQFSFDSTDILTGATPNAHWSIYGLGTDSVEDNSVDPDGDGGPLTPEFDYTDFGVLGGNFDYQFNTVADHWDTVPFPNVITPTVPEPVGFCLAGLAALVFAGRRRSRAN